jgi:hypothetical protein
MDDLRTVFDFYCVRTQFSFLRRNSASECQFLLANNLDIAGNFCVLFQVFSIFDHITHFKFYFRSRIRKEHEKLHRFVFTTDGFKILLS